MATISLLSKELRGDDEREDRHDERLWKSSAKGNSWPVWRESRCLSALFFKWRGANSTLVSKLDCLLSEAEVTIAIWLVSSLGECLPFLTEDILGNWNCVFSLPSNLLSLDGFALWLLVTCCGGANSRKSVPWRSRDMDFQSDISLLLFRSPGGVDFPTSSLVVDSNTADPVLLLGSNGAGCSGGANRVLAPTLELWSFFVSIADRVYLRTIDTCFRFWSAGWVIGEARWVIVCFTVTEVCVSRRNNRGDDNGLKVGDDCRLFTRDVYGFEWVSIMFSITSLLLCSGELFITWRWFFIFSSPSEAKLSSLCGDVRLVNKRWYSLFVSSVLESLLKLCLSSLDSKLTVSPLALLLSIWEEILAPLFSWSKLVTCSSTELVRVRCSFKSFVVHGNSLESSEEQNESCILRSFSNPGDGSRGVFSPSEIWKLNFSSSDSERTDVFLDSLCFPSLLPLFSIFSLASSSQFNISSMSRGSKWHTERFLLRSICGELLWISFPKSEPSRLLQGKEGSSFSAAYTIVWFLRSVWPIKGQENLRMSCILTRHSSNCTICASSRSPVSIFSRQAFISSLVVSKSAAFMT